MPMGVIHDLNPEPYSSDANGYEPIRRPSRRCEALISVYVIGRRVRSG